MTRGPLTVGQALAMQAIALVAVLFLMAVLWGAPRVLLWLCALAG